MRSFFNPGQQTLSLGAIAFDKFGRPVQQLTLGLGDAGAGTVSWGTLFVGMLIGGTVGLFAAGAVCRR